MYAFFNSSGSLTSFIQKKYVNNVLVDETIIQGSVAANTLYVDFAGLPRSSYGIASIIFKRADGSVSPEILMEISNFTYNAVAYEGFSFNFYDYWFLGLAGQLDITIRLFGNQSPVIVATGLITLAVQKSVTTEQTYITPDQYENLLEVISEGVAALDVTNIPYIGFDQNNPVVPTLADMTWDVGNGTVVIGGYNNTQIHIGEDVKYYGKANVSIAAGQVVQYSGYEGDHILMKPAVRTEINANPYLVLGIAEKSISNGQFGYVCAFGKIENIDTGVFTAGSQLYVNTNAGAANGSLIDTKPTTGNAEILIASVIKQETSGPANNGVYQVRLTIHPLLGQQNNVSIINPLNGQVLWYNSTTSKWENKTLVSGDIGAQPAGSYATLDIGGKVPAAQLPSYVDDVLEFADLASFPVTGETGKVYIAINNPPSAKSKTYRWSGSVYVEINPQEIQDAVETPFVPYQQITDTDVQNAIEKVYDLTAFVAQNEYSPGYVELNVGSNIFAAYALNNHVHGLINTTGSSTSTITPIQTGDAIMIADNNDSQKIKRGVQFNTATPSAGFFLNEDGTFKRPTHVETLFASVSLNSGSNGAGATPALGSLLLFDYVVLEIEQEFQASGETLMTRIELPQNRFYNGLQGGKAGAWLTTPNYFVPGGYLTVAIYPNNLTTLDIDLLYQGGSNTQFWRVNVLGGNYV